MTTYKGNAGNLMQHWTLCELLVAAGKHASRLNFIDAHAMAPLADQMTRKSEDDLFDLVRGRVQKSSPDDLESAYERAWHRLEPKRGYPNSAAFVEQVWKGDYSLLLCEKDRVTADEIDRCLPSTRKSPNCKEANLFRGDWRSRFCQGLPSPSGVGLVGPSLTLISFDPYMYNSRRRFDDPKKRDCGNLYPDDIERAVNNMRQVEGGILIQLSTYNTNDTNPQGTVISSVNSILAAKDFNLCAIVFIDNKMYRNTMMSLVYARKIWWSAELADLPSRFTKWLRLPRTS